MMVNNHFPANDTSEPIRISTRPGEGGDDLGLDDFDFDLADDDACANGAFDHMFLEEEAAAAPLLLEPAPPLGLVPTVPVSSGAGCGRQAQSNPVSCPSTPIQDVVSSSSCPAPLRRVTLDSMSVPPFSSRGFHPGLRSEPSPIERHPEYHQALHKLARSMQYTAQSRQQLLVQRALMGRQHPHQHQQRQGVVSPTFSTLRRQLQRRVTATRTGPSDGRWEVCRDFLAGARTTLTDELARSRQQLPAAARRRLQRRVTGGASPAVTATRTGPSDDRWEVYRDFLAGARTTLTDELARSRQQLRAFDCVRLQGRV